MELDVGLVLDPWLRLVCGESQGGIRVIPSGIRRVTCGMEFRWNSLRAVRNEQKEKRLGV